MRGSCARASQHRLKTFKITSKGMKANELLDHLKQQRGNNEEMKKEEMDNLLKDTHEDEETTRKEKVKTKERHFAMTTTWPIQGSWKANFKDENDSTFLSLNGDSLANWSRANNKAERLKHIFEKAQNRSNGFARRVHELGTITPVQDIGPDTLKNSRKYTLCGIIQQKGGQRSRDREGPTGRYSHNTERITDSTRYYLRS